MPAPKTSKSSPGIALKPLREHSAARFEEWVKKTPDHEAALRSLQEKTLSILASDSATFDQIQELLEEVVQAADALDDGHAFAASQKLTSELGSLARAALSVGVPVFPELAVDLRITASSSSAGGESAIKPGSRTKLGGKPDWIQPDETPICEQCQKAMTFVAQIDSVANQASDLGERLSEKNSFMFADVGMIYVFWCSKCYETRSVLQCD
ncbi:MAG TPA: hypothetical protein VNZ64_04120 [Candidatus Acidoferrum sp.]|jgi:hypothetical protein|nr:hypothetical protein [Candidatus Acidoferrum sp.]